MKTAGNKPKEWLLKKEMELEKREKTVKAAEVELDKQRTLFDGFRDMPSYQSYYKNLMQIKKLQRDKEFLTTSIGFKRTQIDKDKIVEKDERYKDGMRPGWLLEEDIKTLYIQIEEIEMNIKFLEKTNEILLKDRIKK